jgi:hypothetical protein
MGPPTRAHGPCRLAAPHATPFLCSRSRARVRHLPRTRARRSIVSASCRSRSIVSINRIAQVNRIRELPQQPEIVVTHSDCEEVYVWNTRNQPDRAPSKESGKARPGL